MFTTLEVPIISLFRPLKAVNLGHFIIMPFCIGITYQTM